MSTRLRSVSGVWWILPLPYWHTNTHFIFVSAILKLKLKSQRQRCMFECLYPKDHLAKSDNDILPPKKIFLLWAVGASFHVRDIIRPIIPHQLQLGANSLPPVERQYHWCSAQIQACLYSTSETRDEQLWTHPRDLRHELCSHRSTTAPLFQQQRQQTCFHDNIRLQAIMLSQDESLPLWFKQYRRYFVQFQVKATRITSTGTHYPCFQFVTCSFVCFPSVLKWVILLTNQQRQKHNLLGRGILWTLLIISLRWGNQDTTSQEKLSSGTLKDKGRETDQRTPGEEE